MLCCAVLSAYVFFLHSQAFESPHGIGLCERLLIIPPHSLLPTLYREVAPRPSERRSLLARLGLPAPQGCKKGGGTRWRREEEANGTPFLHLPQVRRPRDGGSVHRWKCSQIFSAANTHLEQMWRNRASGDWRLNLVPTQTLGNTFASQLAKHRLRG